MISEKEKLRKIILEARRGLPPGERAEKSRAIQSRFFSLNEYLSAATVMVYVSMPDEVATGEIILRALEEGKRVAVPSLLSNRSAITPSLIRDPRRELAEGVFGIKEPLPEFIKPVDLEEIDIVAVPGVAFDRKGNRVGFGGGYYDRLLAGMPQRTCAAALAFGLQVLGSVPAGGFDQPMDFVVTEEGVRRCRP